MKKTVLTLIIILLAVYAVFSILGWGGEYAAERLFYRAMMANEKIIVNPEVAPPQLLAYVEKNLQKLLKKYPDTETAKGARLALAEFYLSHEKYDKAHSTLDDVIYVEKEDIAILSKAHFMKGIVYERQDEWNKALKEYGILRDEYTETALGLQIPLYIGRYYVEKGDEAGVNKAYNEAARFYERLAKENKGKTLGYTASTLLRQTYMILGEYGEAGRVLEDIINTYPTERTFAQQLPFVELIFVTKLKRPEKAIEIYKYVQNMTDYDKLKEFLQEKIEQLKIQE